MNKFTVLLVFFTSLLVSFIVYGNTLKGGFVYDDSYFTGNTSLRKPEYIKSIFISPYNVGGSGNYRPMSSVSYLANFITTGESPFGFHLFNVSLHGINVFLIVLLISTLFKNKKLAVVVALLFAVFPIHSENIANIKGREEVLSTLFFLLSWLVFNNATKNTDKISYLKLFLSSLFFLFSSLSKELSILNFGVFVGYFLLSGKRNIAEVFKTSMFYIVAIFIHLFLRYLALGQFIFKFNSPYFVNNPLYFEDIFMRFISSLKIIFLYVSKTVFPANLSATYHFAHFKSLSGTQDLFPIVSGLVIVIIMLPFIFNRKYTNNILILGSLVLLVPYFLISQIIFPQGDVMAERFFYFPSLGVAIIMAFFLHKLLVSKKTVGILLLATLISSYTFYAISRNRVWQTNRTLFESMVKDAPESIQGYYGLSLEELKDGNTSLAVIYADKAYSINKDYPPVINIVAATRLSQGKLLEAEDLYLRSIDIEPGLPQTLLGLSNVYYAQAKYQEAMNVIQKVAELTEDVKIESAVTYAASLSKLKKYNQSINFIMRFPPEFQSQPTLRFILAVNYYKLAKIEESLKYFDWDQTISHEEKIKRITNY